MVVFVSPCVYLEKPLRNRSGMRLKQDGATSQTAPFCKLIE